MEVKFSKTALIGAGLLSATTIGLLAIAFSRKKCTKRYPGKKGTPFIGNIECLNPKDLIVKLSELKDELGDVYELWIMGKRIIVLCNRDMANEVLLRRPKLFHRPPGMRAGFRSLNILNSEFVSEGEQWGRLRRLISASFNRKSVSQMQEAMMIEVDIMISRMKAKANLGNSSDMGHELMLFTVRVIMAVSLGNLEGLSDYCGSLQMYNDTTKIFEYLLARVIFPGAQWVWDLLSWVDPLHKDSHAATKRLDALVVDILNNQRRAADANLGNNIGTEAGDNSKPISRSFIENLTSAGFAQSVAGDKIFEDPSNEGVKRGSTTMSNVTDTEVIDNIKTVLLAGSETTAVVMAWTLFFLHLPQNSTLLENARREADSYRNQLTAKGSKNCSLPSLPFMEACFKEAGRMRGPAPMLAFTCDDSPDPVILRSVSVNVGEVVIDNTDEIFLPFETLMHDPDIFIDPHSFNPYRWIVDGTTDSNGNKYHSTTTLEQQKVMNMQNYLFGGGPRICPGQELAMKEGPVCLAAILCNFNMQLACKPEEIERVLGFTAKAKELPMKFTVRVSSVTSQC